MFKLSKWYLDVITEDGSAFIGYAARLEWGPLRVAYGATLLALSGAAVIERVIDSFMMKICSAAAMNSRISQVRRSVSVTACPES